MSRLEQEPIKVVSLDYDGCFREAFDGDAHESQAKAFFANALKGAQSLYIGTARQGRLAEYGHAWNHKPSYANYESFAQGNDVSLVPLLLEDVWQEKPEGTYFEEAKKAVRETSDIQALYQSTKKIKEPPCFPHKIGIAYLQMQHAAQNAQGASVAFHFYDDRGDFLVDMLAFFKRHRELMPSNVTLSCHHVDIKNNNCTGFSKNEGRAFGDVSSYTSDPLSGQGNVLSEEHLFDSFKKALDALDSFQGLHRIELKWDDNPIQLNEDAPREAHFATVLASCYPQSSLDVVASTEVTPVENNDANNEEKLGDSAENLNEQSGEEKESVDSVVPSVVKRNGTEYSLVTVSDNQAELIPHPSFSLMDESRKQWLLDPRTTNGLAVGVAAGVGVFGLASATTSMVLVNAFASAGAAASFANVLAANPIAIGLAAFAVVGAVLASVMGGLLAQSRQVSTQSMLRQSAHERNGNDREVEPQHLDL